MKKLSRIFALLLCLCMMFALFSGCGSSSDEDETEAETETETEAEAEDEEEAEAEEAEEEEEEEAEEESDLLFDPTSYPLVDDDSVTFTMFGRFQTTLLTNLSSGNWDTNPAYLQSVETTGISIEFTTIANDNYSDQFYISIAGGDYPDFYDVVPVVYTAGSDNAIEEEIIIDLSPYLEDYAPDYWAILEEDEEVRKGSTTDSGNIAAFYQIKMEEDWSANRGPFIRQDWLDDLGLDIPETYDELHDVLLAFTTEKGATSAIWMNMYGVLAGSSLASGYEVVCGTNGVDAFLYQIDGTVYCGFQQDGFKEYLTMLNEWYNEGIVSQDFVGVDFFSDDLTTAIANSETGYWIEEYRTSADQWAVDCVDEDCVITAIPEAVKESGQTIHINSNGGRIDYPGMSITTACEEVELAVAYLNYWYSEEGIILQNYGFEGETYYIDEDGNYRLTDLILNDPDGYSAETMAYTYCFFQTSTLLDNKRLLSTDLADDRQTWATNKDGAYDLPKDTVLSISVDESTIYANAYGDVLTYVQENVSKFITGALSLEDDWDTFQDTIVELGIQDCIDVYQAALDRYNER